MTINATTNQIPPAMPTTPPLIPPSVGRVVLYHPGQNEGYGTTPLAAIVTYVWGQRMVNLGVFTPNGVVMSRTSVVLQQPGDPQPLGGYCSWMPYQLGQALGASHWAQELDALRTQVQALDVKLTTLQQWTGAVPRPVAHTPGPVQNGPGAALKAYDAFAHPVPAGLTRGYARPDLSRPGPAYTASSLQGSGASGVVSHSDHAAFDSPSLWPRFGTAYMAAQPPGVAGAVSHSDEKIALQDKVVPVDVPVPAPRFLASSCASSFDRDAQDSRPAYAAPDVSPATSHDTSSASTDCGSSSTD